jgi:hypothetical protein
MQSESPDIFLAQAERTRDAPAASLAGPSRPHAVELERRILKTAAPPSDDRYA